MLVIEQFSNERKTSRWYVGAMIAFNILSDFC